MDPLVAHQRAQDTFALVLVNVTTEQLSSPTPCHAWDVKALIDHVIVGNQRVVVRAGGQVAPLPEDLGALSAADEVRALVQEGFWSHAHHCYLRMQRLVAELVGRYQQDAHALLTLAGRRRSGGRARRLDLDFQAGVSLAQRLLNRHAGFEQNAQQRDKGGNLS